MSMIQIQRAILSSLGLVLESPSKADSASVVLERGLSVSNQLPGSAEAAVLGPHTGD